MYKQRQETENIYVILQDCRKPSGQVKTASDLLRDALAAGQLDAGVHLYVHHDTAEPVRDKQAVAAPEFPDADKSFYILCHVPIEDGQRLTAAQKEVIRQAEQEYGCGKHTILTGIVRSF